MINNYILIIGAMKSGTTSLFDLLAQHPQIAPCKPKEPGFFAFEDRWAEGFDWYEALFDFDPAIHRYGLDGSTDYTKHPFVSGVADRLVASAPRHFKLIYLMRDPLSRIESHARHVQRTKMEVGKSVSHRRDHSLDAGVSPVSMAISRYASQLEQFRSFANAGDLLTLTLDDLTDRQDEVMARVFAFLDLEQADLVLNQKNAAGSKRQKPGYWQSLGRLGPVSRAARALVPPRARRELRDRLSTKVTVEGRFELTDAEKARIRDDLGGDLAALKAVYGIDFTD